MCYWQGEFLIPCFVEKNGGGSEKKQGEENAKGELLLERVAPLFCLRCVPELRKLQEQEQKPACYLTYAIFTPYRI